MMKTAVRELSAADQTLFGSNIPMQHSYDVGTNGIGRINTVSGPYFSRSYDYDTFGPIASETFDYNLSGTSIGGTAAGSKTRTFSYNRAGSPSALTTAAGLSLQYEHDSAGRENALTWKTSTRGQSRLRP